MQRRVAVRAIAFFEGKLLCVRLKPYKESIRNVSNDEWWCLPGGKLDDGEALLPALHREMVEETNIAPQIGKLLYVQQFMHDGREHVEFFFHIKNAHDYRNVDLSQATHGVHEIEAIGFIDPKATNVLPAFLTTEPLAEHIQTSTPVKIISFA